MIPALVFIPPVIAHRGAGQVAPENTLAAIRGVREQGVNWVELDVKITYDGVPILMHDETLERTTTGQGLVSDVSWEDLQRLDAGVHFGSRFAGEPVPHLSDAVNEVLKNNLSLMLEMKPCPGRAKATAMVAMIEIAKIWPERDIYPVISSFDLECLEIAAQLEPHWPRIIFMRQWDNVWKNWAKQLGVSGVALPQEQLTHDRVRELILADLTILAYTVNDPVRAKELLAWGVSAVYSDDPRTILSHL